MDRPSTMDSTLCPRNGLILILELYVEAWPEDHHHVSVLSHRMGSTMNVPSQSSKTINPHYVISELQVWR